MLVPRFDNRAPRVLLGSVLLVGTLALGACSSDDDDDTESVPDTGGETSEPVPGAGPGDEVDLSPVTYDIELTVEQEVPAPTGADGASGQAALVFDPATRGMTGTVTTSGLSGPPTMAHIHEQLAGEMTGPPIVTLIEDGNGTGGYVLADDVILTEEQAESLQTGLLYVNVHTELNQMGEIRGQLVLPESDPAPDASGETSEPVPGTGSGDEIDLSPIAYDVALTVEQEIPAPTGADGASGQAALVFDPATRGMTGTVTTSDLSGPPTMAHIHEQPAGEMTGPPIVTFIDDGNGTGGYVLADDVILTEEQAESLQTGLLYVNVHTELNGMGEIRGQLVLPESDGDN